MRITITGRNIDITDGLRSAVEDKLSKLEKYFTPDTDVFVTLSVEKERQKIEVTIPVKGNIIRSEQVSNDMVGSPYQTTQTLAEDLFFIQELQPHMVGIGPFVPHHETPFGKEAGGTVRQTLYLLSLIRILKPDVLLPATTALGTIDPLGREKGVQAGANVVMPNLSPTNVRKKYELYDNKICTGDEAAECRYCLNRRMETIGCELATDRGDAPGWEHR